MSCSKEIQSAILRASFVFVGGLFITLLPMTSLSAANQDAIQQYELSGNYAAALKIARNSDTRNFLQTVKRLEQELLALGSLRLLFDENYQPRDKLIQLLELVGMEPLNRSERAIVQINNWAQKNLLRQGERWQEQTDRFEKLKLQIKPLLSELGFVDALFPHFKEYQGVIVHGALLPRARLRLYYLIEQWEQGITHIPRVRMHSRIFSEMVVPKLVKYEV